MNKETKLVEHFEISKGDEAAASDWKKNMTQKQAEAYNEFIDCMVNLYKKYNHMGERKNYESNKKTG